MTIAHWGECPLPEGPGPAMTIDPEREGLPGHAMTNTQVENLKPSNRHASRQSRRTQRPKKPGTTTVTVLQKHHPASIKFSLVCLPRSGSTDFFLGSIESDRRSNLQTVAFYFDPCSIHKYKGVYVRGRQDGPPALSRPSICGPRANPVFNCSSSFPRHPSPTTSYNDLDHLRGP